MRCKRLLEFVRGGNFHDTFETIDFILFLFDE